MPVEIDDVRCMRESSEAILCRIDGAEHWIPNSQVDEDSEVLGVGDIGTLIISDWIAEQKGIEGTKRSTGVVWKKKG